jgi:hypothetical protein
VFTGLSYGSFLPRISDRLTIQQPSSLNLAATPATPWYL